MVRSRVDEFSEYFEDRVLCFQDCCYNVINYEKWVTNFSVYSLKPSRLVVFWFKLNFNLFQFTHIKYHEIVEEQDNTGGLSGNFLVSLNILNSIKFDRNIFN